MRTIGALIQLSLLCGLTLLCFAKQAQTAEDFDLILGVAVQAKCDQRFCATDKSAGLFPGSLVQKGPRPPLTLKQCPADIQNQSGFVGFASKIVISAAALKKVLSDSAAPELVALKAIEQMFEGGVQIEIDIQYREDIEQSTFEKLVRSVPAECHLAAKLAPSAWSIVTSRYFGKVRILISLPRGMPTESAFRILKPFALESSKNYEVSAYSSRQLEFINRDYVLYALKTQPFLDYAKQYPGTLK